MKDQKEEKKCDCECHTFKSMSIKLPLGKCQYCGHSLDNQAKGESKIQNG